MEKENRAILIYHVNVINMHDGSVAVDKAILIKDNIIEAIDDYAKLKSKVSQDNQIDAAGRYAIPGLWDMHMHIEGQDLSCLVANRNDG
jgi:predicted amidohydrolase YtcJ